MKHQKLFSAIGIVAWSGFVVAAYFVVQKPFALQIADHLVDLAWTFILTCMLVLNGITLGRFTIRRFISDAIHDASLLALACGIGLSELDCLVSFLRQPGLRTFLFY